MREERLLEAIGDIDDRLIEEATPEKKPKITHIPWVKYGSIAACFLLFVVFVYGVSAIRMGGKSDAAADTAAPEAFIQEDAALEESTEETADMEEAAAEEDVAEETEAETPAEDAPPENGATNDVAYGIMVNDHTYYPISFEERKQFDLIPEDAAGLTSENTYQITKEDLGEVIGTVSDSKIGTNIGLTLYHFTKYPQSDAIGILDNHGTYEFYVSNEP